MPAPKTKDVLSSEWARRHWPKALSGVVAAGGLAWLYRRYSRPQLERAPTFEEAPESSHIRMVDGISMRWEELGDPTGFPVIFVHGIPTNPRLWRYVMPKIMRPGIRLMAWEPVGFGWSMEQGLNLDISVAKQAEYFATWLRYLGIKRAVFVGHDLGGGVLQRFVVTHPEYCAGLVLTNCIAYDNWPVPMVRVARAMRSGLAQLPPSVFKPIFHTALTYLGHDSIRRGAKSMAIHWQPYDRPIGPKAFAHQLACLDSRDTENLGPELRRLQVPAQVVWGDCGPLGLSSGMKLANDLGASFQRIRGGGHFTPEDHPQEIAQAIQSLLEEHVRPSTQSVELH